MIKQLQQHQASQVATGAGLSLNSPKRVELNTANRQQLLTQTIIHQTYGVQPQPAMPQAHILAQYQNQQQQATNMQLRQLSASQVIPSNYSPPIPGATSVVPGANRNLACLQMSYYSQSPHFGETVHSSQVSNRISAARLSAKFSTTHRSITRRFNSLRRSRAFHPQLALIG